MLFPGGVADPALGRAYVRDRTGAMSSIDLETGRVLWKRGAGWRPIAVAPGAVVLTRPGPGRLEIAALDAEDGHERMRTTADLPDWVQPSDDAADLSLRGTVTGDRLRLWWTARGGYRGGAPPSDEKLTEHNRESGGVIEVDLRDGTVSEVEAAAPGDDAELAQHRLPVSDTGVLDAARIGPYRYNLAATASGPLVLRAVDDRTSVTRWELALDAGPSRAPRRPRP
ncbi:MAG TPA: hypothetical protein VFR67_28545 [Pilimelia sp.]|nr:hypothetical protein [Pilimelia sp.]